MSRTRRAQLLAILTVLLTVPVNGVLADRAAAFEVGVHEGLDDDALAFLRPGVIDDLRDEHDDWADAFFGDAKDVSWVHADNCALGETAEQINSFHAQAIANLTPGPTFDPWSATDDFGRLFHPIQDFYSHSNWVELGFPANDDPSTTDIEVSSDDLVDFGTRLAGPDGLGEWTTPGPKGTVRDDILLDDMVVTPLTDAGKGFLVVDGSQPIVVHDLEPGWRVGLLPDPTDPSKASFVPGIDTTGDANFSYLDTPGPFSVPVMTSGADKRFLLSGVGARPAGSVVDNQCDPYVRNAQGERVTPLQVNPCLNEDGIPDPPDDFSCIAYYGSRFALTHGGTERSGINKDSSSESPLHPQARALALLQSKYEWCRFVNLASLSGADGVLLSLWVKENASANPAGTPCAPDGDGGPTGVTVTIDKVTVVNDHDPLAGEINLSLAVYDSPAAFHRLDKTKSGPVDAEDDEASRDLTGSEVPAPITQCVRRADSTFRVALHGWDDDDVIDGGDFGDNVASADEALVGFTETLSADLPIGASEVRHASSSDLDVEYTVTRAPDTDGDGLDSCGEAWHGTDPAAPDTDGDDLPDGTEVLGANPTQPLDADSDDDGLNDGTEDTNKNGAFDLGETNPNDADSDDDGIVDGKDVEWIQSAIAAIPASALQGGEQGLRMAMNSILDAAERRIAKQDGDGMIGTLQTLRKRMDGCGAESDRDDWITDCAVQTEIRALVDILIANVH